MQIRRPFGHSAWAAPYRGRARLFLDAAETSPISIGELALLIGHELAELVPADCSLGYGEAGGGLALRTAIASGLPGLGPEDIVVTTGAGEAGAALIAAVGVEGRHIVVQSPTAESVFTALDRARCSWSAVAETEGADGLLEAMGPQTCAVFLASPNNPTGRVVEAADLIRLAEALDRVGGVLVVDEVFRGIGLGLPVQPAAATLAPNAVSVASLSKAYGLPGLRVGWVAGPPLVVDDVRTFHRCASKCLAASSERLAQVALEHGAALLQRTRDLEHDHLVALGALAERHTALALSLPDGGTLAFPALPGLDVDEWCATLVEETGLLLAPGNACFGIPGHVRLNLAAQRSVWADALPTLDAALERLPLAASG